MVKKIKAEDPKGTPEEKKEAAPTKEIFDSEGELVVDVFETDSDFVVLAAIAGVQIKDIDISLEKDMMVIKGNRSDPHEIPDKKYFYQECYWGPFSRKIILPENIDIDKADAQMDKGVLTIKIPKNETKTKIGVKVS
ncbi:MAG: Hsp20/alpha crystallin family protein [Candidatus Staskawiczbacteria bacterium]|jgi:HSP20 family protein